MCCLMVLPYEGMVREASDQDKFHTSFSEVTVRASTRRASSLVGELSVFNTCLVLRLLLCTRSVGMKLGVCSVFCEDTGSCGFDQEAVQVEGTARQLVEQTSGH